MIQIKPPKFATHYAVTTDLDGSLRVEFFTERDAPKFAQPVPVAQTAAGYTAWRATYQSSEQAARSAYTEMVRLHNDR